MKSILFLLTLLFSFETFAGNLKGEAYLTECKQALSFFGEHGDKSLEDRFVALADTPGKMLQLLYDYKLLVSKTFSDAVNLELKQQKNLARTNEDFFVVRKLLELPQDQWAKLVWDVMETNILLKSNSITDSQSQVVYNKTKSLVESLKKSERRALFENVAGTWIKLSLAEHAKSHYGSAATRVGWRFIKYSALFGGLGYIPLVLIGYPDLAPLGKVLASIGAFAGGGVVSGFAMMGPATVLMKRLEKRYQKYLNKISDGSKASLVEKSKTVEIEFDKILEQQQEMVKDEVLSIEKACQERTCDLNPVQIAYVGQIDILEFQILERAVKDMLRTVNMTRDMEALEKAARAVVENPSAYDAQMVLAIRLKNTLVRMTDVLKMRDESVRNLTAAATNISSLQLDALQAKAYDDTPDTVGDFAKSNFLLEKVKSDGPALRQIKVDVSALEAQVKSTQNVVEVLSQLYNQLPSGREGWKPIAEEVISKLNELSQ